MAKSAFCSNEQIIKLAQKRYKNQLNVIYTPFMMFLEEYIEYLQQHSIKNGFSMPEITEMARQNWKKVKKCDKVRYKELAQKANNH